MPSVRHSESRSFSLLLLSLFVLSSLVHDALAVGVTFTTPAAGATWPAGPITVRWTDAGGSPDMAALDTYELQLIVGGNDPLNSKPIATIGTAGGKVSTGQVTGTIDPEIAQSFENGFYFRMISNTTDGNTVINYSNRFTLINMKGTTDSAYLDGANAARGSGNVPAAQYNIVAQPTNTATASSSATATTTVVPTATATATETSTPSDDGPGLGMMIGIGVGSFLALVGVVSLFVWAFMLYRHKKKRKEQQRIKDNNNNLDRPRGVSQFGKAELPARNSLATPQSAYTTELSPIGAKYELEGDGRAVEAARASIYELDSGWDGWEAMSGRKSTAYDPTDVV